MKADIKVDGVSLSKAFIAEHKSESDFLEAMNEKTYSHLFEGTNREAKLKSVYALVHPKTEAPKVAASKEAGKAK